MAIPTPISRPAPRRAHGSLSASVQKGDPVRVVAVDGMRLTYVARHLWVANS